MTQSSKSLQTDKGEMTCLCRRGPCASSPLPLTVDVVLHLRKSHVIHH